MVLRLLALFCLTSLCQPSLAQQSEISRPRAPDTCPVTKPSDHPFVPPPPYRPSSGFAFWFGTDTVWTTLMSDGISGQGEKSFWFSQEWSHYRRWIPDKVSTKLKVTARRLDAPTPPPEISAGPTFNQDWQASCSEASTSRRPDAGRLPGDTKMPKCSLLYGLYLTRPRNKRPRCQSSLINPAGSSLSPTPWSSATTLTPFVMTPSVTLRACYRPSISKRRSSTANALASLSGSPNRNTSSRIQPTNPPYSSFGIRFRRIGS
jgi:hypothetical protein